MLALFDLDGFKAFNDTHGHAAGDQLLRRVARCITAAGGADGRAYRLGGDELCLVVRDEGGALARIHTAARTLREGGITPISASVGVATLPGEAMSADAALALADARMYAEKARRPGARRPSVDVVPMANALASRPSGAVVV